MGEEKKKPPFQKIIATLKTVTFELKNDELEVYFSLDDEERDLLDKYVHDETFFDDDSKPSFLVIRFRKKER
jgi:hypothetical protein